MIIENEELCCSIPVIGGRCDGQKLLINREELYEGTRKLGDRLILPEPFKMASILDYGEQIKEDAVTSRHHDYTLRLFHYSTNEIYYYLAPRNWSDKEAMKHQMRK